MSEATKEIRCPQDAVDLAERRLTGEKDIRAISQAAHDILKERGTDLDADLCRSVHEFITAEAGLWEVSLRTVGEMALGPEGEIFKTLSNEQMRLADDAGDEIRRRVKPGEWRNGTAIPAVQGPQGLFALLALINFWMDGQRGEVLIANEDSRSLALATISGRHGRGE